MRCQKNKKGFPYFAFFYILRYMSRLAKYLVIGCTVLVVGVCAYFVMTTLYRRTNRITESESAFHLGMARLDSVLQKGASFASAEWKSAIRGLFTDDPELTALIVYGFDSGIEYLFARKEADSFRSLLTDDWKGQPGYETTTMMHHVSSDSFVSRPGMFVDMVFTVFDSTHYVPLLKKVAVAIMAYLTSVILIVGLITRRPSQSLYRPQFAEGPKNPTNTNKETRRERSFMKRTVKADSVDTFHPVAENRTASLYSPDTGLGWKAFLNERLDHELKRAASFDQDLALAVFRCVGFDVENYHQVIAQLHELFTFKDLNFELSDREFCVIMPNMDLYQGTVRVEAYLKQVKPLLNDGTRKISVGMSTRNGRLLNAHRLIQEALSSLNKAAKTSVSSIIAFKTDPKKYRSYIAGHTAH